MESALSAVPFERVIEVCGFGWECLNVESALSAFDLKAEGPTEGGGEWNLRYLQSHLKWSYNFVFLDVGV